MENSFQILIIAAQALLARIVGDDLKMVLSTLIDEAQYYFAFAARVEDDRQREVDEHDKTRRVLADTQDALAEARRKLDAEVTAALAARNAFGANLIAVQEDNLEASKALELFRRSDNTMCAAIRSIVASHDTNKIGAIKDVRVATGWGLVEAKAAVEAVLEGRDPIQASAEASKRRAR